MFGLEKLGLLQVLASSTKMMAAGNRILAIDLLLLDADWKSVSVVLASAYTLIGAAKEVIH